MIDFITATAIIENSRCIGEEIIINTKGNRARTILKLVLILLGFLRAVQKILLFTDNFLLFSFVLFHFFHRQVHYTWRMETFLCLWGNSIIDKKILALYSWAFVRATEQSCIKREIVWLSAKYAFEKRFSKLLKTLQNDQSLSIKD